MKVDYAKGKIYKLTNTVNTDIYIGSTASSLSRRITGHRSDAKRKPNQRVYKSLNAVGWDNVKIVLIEEIKCENKDQLIRREQYYIDLIKPALNRQSAKDTCSHGRKQAMCVECGGSYICIHKRERNKCVDCGGVSICVHNKRRNCCIDCNNFLCIPCDRKYCSKHDLARHTAKFHPTN